MGKTLVTGGTGFLGTHVVRALAERGDQLRLLLRRGSEPRPSVGPRVRARQRGRHRPAGGAQGDGGRRARLPSRRHDLDAPQNRDAVFELNVKGTRIVLEEALAAKVKRVVHTSSVAAIGPAKPHGTADETQPFTAGHLGIAYVNSKHEAEVEALRLAAHGLPVVIVNPSFVLGPDDPKGTSMELVRRFLLGRIPAYVDGGSTSSTSATSPQGHLLADEKGEVGERYILAGRNFTLDRLFADFARISGREQPPVKLPGAPDRARRRGHGRAGLPLPVSPDEVRSATQWWTYRNTKARRRAGLRAATPRGDARGRRALADGAARRPGQDRRGARRRRPWRPSPRCARWEGGCSDGERGDVVLYRCPTPTNVLCPCGAVARRLGKLGLEYRTERVPYRRSEPAGDRGADPPEAGAGARRRRPGDPRLEADPPVPRVEVRNWASPTTRFWSSRRITAT